MVLGRRKPLVKVDNTFVDPVFTSYYAQAALARVTLPNLWDHHGACFLPNLFVLDQYGLNMSNELIDGYIPMVTERLLSGYGAIDPRLLGSQVTGRWAYNML
jgi:hypothetical protein